MADIFTFEAPIVKVVKDGGLKINDISGTVLTALKAYDYDENSILTSEEVRKGARSSDEGLINPAQPGIVELNENFAQLIDQNGGNITVYEAKEHVMSAVRDMNKDKDDKLSFAEMSIPHDVLRPLVDKAVLIKNDTNKNGKADLGDASITVDEAMIIAGGYDPLIRNIFPDLDDSGLPLTSHAADADTDRDKQVSLLEAAQKLHQLTSPDAELGTPKTPNKIETDESKALEILKSSAKSL